MVGTAHPIIQWFRIEASTLPIVPMATYKFLTVWLLDGPIEAVWDTLVDYATLPTWWQAVKYVKPLETDNPNQKNGVWDMAWQTPLGYSLAFQATFTRVEPPHVLELSALGELEGAGRWELQRTEEGTLAHYYWNVTTTKAWMNALALFIRPLMIWNHNAIMEQGGIAIANHLNAKLLKQEHHYLKD